MDLRIRPLKSGIVVLQKLLEKQKFNSKMSSGETKLSQQNFLDCYKYEENLTKRKVRYGNP